MFYLQCTKYDRIFWEYCLLCFGLVLLLFRKITLQRQKTVSPIKLHLQPNIETLMASIACILLPLQQYQDNTA